MRQGVIAAGKEAGYTSVSNNSKVGLSKAGSEFNVGRSGAKKLASSRKTTMLTRAVGKLAGPLGAIIETMIPRTAGAPSVSEWKKDEENAVYKDSYLTGNINTAGPADLRIRHNERETRKKMGLPKRNQNY
tara:strand:+ start:2625 stop:3017 length:393 start_codon:yes stop_codon:yes gene_type:complete